MPSAPDHSPLELEYVLVDVFTETPLAGNQLAVVFDNPFALVALRSVDALERLSVRHEEATPWLRERGARWFYVFAPTGAQEPAWRARMQFKGGEDPATGSAAGPAIAYLVGRGAVPADKRIHLRQGVEIGRPSDLYLAANLVSGRVTDVRVAGSTVLVGNGQLLLPYPLKPKQGLSGPPP